MCTTEFAEQYAVRFFTALRLFRMTKKMVDISLSNGYNRYVKYLYQTFSYLKKNFWLAVAVMIVPSVVACFLSVPYWEVAFVTGFDYNPYIKVGATFALVFDDSWQFLWPIVLISALQVVASALIMSSIDRHFRTGKLSLRSPWRMINNSIFPIAIGVVLMSVLSVVLRFLLFGLVSLSQAICHAIGASTGAALTVISVVAVALFVLHALIVMPMLFWAPIMFIYGYKFRDAAALSFKLISGKKIFGGLLLPMLVCAGVQMLMGFLQVSAWAICLTSFFVFLFTNVYATVYTMITFYSVSDLERRDVKPYLNIRLPSAPATEEPPEQPDVEAKTEKDKTAVAETKQASKQKKSTSSAKSKTAKRKAGEEADVV